MKDGRDNIPHVFIQIVVGNVHYFEEEIPFPSCGGGEAAGNKEGFERNKEIEVGSKEVGINEGVERIGLLFSWPNLNGKRDIPLAFTLSTA